MIQLLPIPKSKYRTLKNNYYRYIDELRRYTSDDSMDGPSLLMWKGQLDIREFKFGIYEDNRMKGFVFIGWLNGTWYVFQFYVYPRYRRKGIGTEAVTAIKKMFNGTIWLKTMPKNIPAVMFWLKQTKDCARSGADIIFWLNGQSKQEMM